LLDNRQGFFKTYEMSIYDIGVAKQEYVNQFYQTLLSILNSNGGSTGDISAPRLTLIGLVKVKLDEIMSQSEGIQFSLDNVDNSNTIDLYINALLDESAKHILQIAPKHIINPTDGSSAVPVFTVLSTIGFIYLPDDYLRFVSFKIATWLQEVNALKTTEDPSYKLQKYPFTRGGISKPEVFINSKTKTNVAVAQVDSVTFIGSSGAAQVSGPGGLSKSIGFNTSEIQTATDFITLYAADYTPKGITLSRVNNKITFTAAVAGTPFDHPIVLTESGDLTGEVLRVTANVPTKEAKKVLEYYSDPTVGHTLEKFMYIANVGAEHIQPDLYDALSWLCASKVLQVWGQFSGNASYAEKAMQQVELSFQNAL